MTRNSNNEKNNEKVDSPMSEEIDIIGYFI